jgi:hypothetical protein
MKGRKRWIAAVAAIVVAVSAGLAYAAIPDSSHALGIGPLGAGYRIEGAGIEVTAVAPDPLQQVLSLTLPPGSYAISAEFNVDKRAANAGVGDSPHVRGEPGRCPTGAPTTTDNQPICREVRFQAGPF